ncbi:MAG TPA: HlyD family efflux transporter periplasmic adaptor subunit [Hyalangium sp.]|nr:HlyD family efflux transporter periplasmic adaptor subunit [Hyalangium sp.]
MSLAFTHSLLAMRADGGRRTLLALLGSGLLLAGWLTWFFLAHLTVYEVSQAARVEVRHAAHTVGAPVSGRVVATHLALGRQVQAGDVLVELETSSLKLEREETKTRLAGLSGQLGPLREQLAAQEQALAEHQRITQATIAEARARSRESRVTARLASREAEQAKQLQARGVLSEMQADREGGEAQVRLSAANASRSALERIQAQQRSEESLMRASVAQLSREVAQLEGQLATEAAAIQVLTEQIEARTIRAPISGRLGESTPLQPGSVVGQGNPLCTIIPPGSLKVVAVFPPASAIGRVRAGQPARVRFDGFPWTQYGSLPITVSGVASEVREGLVRVELSVPPEQRSTIPLQHGLTGQVEVEVERASPAMLFLRAAGRGRG